MPDEPIWSEIYDRKVNMEENNTRPLLRTPAAGTLFLLTLGGFLFGYDTGSVTGSWT